MGWFNKIEKDDNMIIRVFEKYVTRAIKLEIQQSTGFGDMWELVNSVVRIEKHCEDFSDKAEYVYVPYIIKAADYKSLSHGVSPLQDTKSPETQSIIKGIDREIFLYAWAHRKPFKVGDFEVIMKETKDRVDVIVEFKVEEL